MEPGERESKGRWGADEERTDGRNLLSQDKQNARTYQVVIHGVLDVILRHWVFPVDNLQFGPVLEWVLLKAEQVEDAPEGLRGGAETIISNCQDGQD